MGKQVTRAAGTVGQEVSAHGLLIRVGHVQLLVAKHHVRQVLHGAPLNDFPCDRCEGQKAIEQQSNMIENMVVYKQNIKRYKHR
jgi:hypothetical protein